METRLVDDDETMVITLEGRPDIGEWAFDAFTGRPLYNPDGTRQRQRVRISNPDDLDDYEDYEVLKVEYTP
jgi:hypothetical protein